MRGLKRKLSEAGGERFFFFFTKKTKNNSYGNDCGILSGPGKNNCGQLIVPGERNCRACSEEIRSSYAM